ncbi:hypothetical protein EVAR_35323_1 [Eumeta japonica]|uniref:Uncharacterized protein n=1 Tax=Eumeta variegata TaxID=151549 RepID=A0A4C1XJU2_EUMVA|nr:hypothetical protein EVAR_35323_1 [Eumeta japonica]
MIGIGNEARIAIESKSISRLSSRMSPPSEQPAEWAWSEREVPRYKNSDKIHQIENVGSSNARRRKIENKHGNSDVRNDIINALAQSPAVSLAADY